MRAISTQKIKYNGCIQKAGIPFSANDADRELLESWGCSILDESGIEKPKQKSKPKTAPTPQSPQADEPQPESKPEAKKTRKRSKS